MWNLLQKRFLAVLILFSLAAKLEAAIFTHPAALHDDYPNRCMEPISRRPILPDKEYKVKGICAAMSCNLETATINIETCPHIHMPNCTEIPADPSKTFPKCCPQFRCTDRQTGEDFVTAL